MSQTGKTAALPPCSDPPMSNDPPYDQLLKATRAAYRAHEGLTAFAPFPDDIAPQPFTPNHRAAADLFLADTALPPGPFPALHAAIRNAAPAMHWRETYRAGSADTAFMERWGCYSIVGNDAPFGSARIRLFIVYMPPGLFYPWHSHPAEEIYLVLAGSAVFKSAGNHPAMLSEGQTAFHTSDQPHAIETGGTPMLSLVAWRNHLDIRPTLTPPAETLAPK